MAYDLKISKFKSILKGRGFTVLDVKENYNSCKAKIVSPLGTERYVSFGKGAKVEFWVEYVLDYFSTLDGESYI